MMVLWDRGKADHNPLHFSYSFICHYELDSRWIKEVPGPENSDSRRRYYRLTSDGNSILNQELARMEALVRKSKAMRLRSVESAS